MSHWDEGTLHTYLDGELEFEEEAQLREHLATCAACRGRLDAEKAMRARAHEILRYADPRGIVAPDFAEVRARRTATGTATARPAGSRVRPLILPWAASVVLALGVGWFAQSLLTGGGPSAARVAIESDVQRPRRGSGAIAERGAIEADAERTAVGPGASPATMGIEADAEPTSGVSEPFAAATLEAGTDQAAEPTTLPPGAGSEEEAVAPFEVAEPQARALADRSEADAAAAAQRSVETELGYVAPETVALLSPPPSRPSALLVPEAGTALANRPWVLADSATARETLGAPLRLLPRLPVLSYSVVADRSGLVRVIQRLPDGEPIEIYQWRPDPAGQEVEVILHGSVAADSLTRLRERLAP